jgi:hypothetical protein
LAVEFERLGPVHQLPDMTNAGMPRRPLAGPCRDLLDDPLRSERAGDGPTPLTAVGKGSPKISGRCSVVDGGDAVFGTEQSFDKSNLSKQNP